MTKTTTAVLLTAALTAVATAGPVLTEADWLAAGDGLLTNDAISGLQWLDWSHTANRSYNDVSSQLGAGGEFEGFRYATEAEVSQLYANAGAPVVDPLVTTNPAYGNPLTDLISFLGSVYPGQTNAIYEQVGSNAEIPTLYGDFGSGPHHLGTAFTTSGSISLRYQNVGDATESSFFGHALVLIPTPSSAALLGFGGLIAARRRRN